MPIIYRSWQIPSFIAANTRDDDKLRERLFLSTSRLSISLPLQTTKKFLICITLCRHSKLSSHILVPWASNPYPSSSFLSILTLGISSLNWKTARILEIKFEDFSLAKHISLVQHLHQNNIIFKQM